MTLLQDGVEWENRRVSLQYLILQNMALESNPDSPKYNKDSFNTDLLITIFLN